MEQCQWCETCGGVGQELTYDGWLLAIRAGNAWHLRPYRGGQGGPAWRLSIEAAPEDWAAYAAVASRVLLVGAHPDADGALDALIEASLTVLAVRATGVKAGDRRWRCQYPGGRVDIPYLPGVGNSEATQLQRAALWLWASGTEGPSWQFEDADGFLAARRAAKDDEKERRERNAWVTARETSIGKEVEVNPYNFVPMGSGAARSRRHGHDVMGEGRIGARVDVQLTALAPLALSGVGKGTEADPHRPHRIGEVWVLPGSSLAGAVRSFHEALTDSCLRIVDLDYLPIHRDVAVPQAVGRWRMAVVGATGRTVELCDQVTFQGKAYAAVWVEVRWLTGAPFTSADRFHYDPAPTDLHLPPMRGRLEQQEGSCAPPTRCTTPNCAQRHWRTIVSQALGTRKVHPRTDREHPHHLPFAPESTVIRELSDQVITDYELAAHDSGDVVRGRRGLAPSLAVPGVGTRQETTPTLTPDHVMWAEVGASGVTRLNASVLWRDKGEGELRARITGYEPCSDPDHLCPSCRLFGAAEEREERDRSGAARVAAYKGHVRFGHLTISAVAGATHLREMGTPRPSAGQFYLDNTGWGGRWASEGQRPLREWGSEADTSRAEPRRIRGRKFYWTATTGTRHRVPAGEQGHELMTSYHRLTPAGSTLTGTVWVDNVSRAELGALLACLDPNLLRHERIRPLVARLTRSYAAEAALDAPLGWHLGKGKGLGLGAITPRIVSATDDATSVRVKVWDASRYRDPAASDQSVDVLDLVEAFLADPEVRPEGWGALLALSAVDWVPPGKLDYPRDDRPGADFRFDFWKRSTGAPGRVEPPVLVALPAADAADVTLRRPWLVGGN